MKKHKTLPRSYLCSLFRNRRLTVGLTQEKMAETLYITELSYGSLERGLSGCSAETLVLLLNGLPDAEVAHTVHELARRMFKSEAEEIDQ